LFLWSLKFRAILNEKIFKNRMAEEPGEAFSIILVIRKLLNYPGLLLDDHSETAKIAVSTYGEQNLFENIWEYSTKMMFTKNILESMRHGEKIIIVSYFGQTLDLIEKVCDAVRLNYLRLDGQVAALYTYIIYLTV
jgi:SNF2 family DNA or RNA helicase